MSCGIVQSIIRQQRSQQAHSPFTCSWPFHTQPPPFFFLTSDLCGAYHTMKGGRGAGQDAGVWDQQQQRVIMSAKMGPRGNKAGTTSAEMSQMSRIHSHRLEKREDDWWGGVSSEAAGVGGSADKGMNVLVCFRGLSVGGQQSRGYHFIVKIDQAGIYSKNETNLCREKMMWLLFGLMDASLKINVKMTPLPHQPIKTR